MTSADDTTVAPDSGDVFAELDMPETKQEEVAPQPEPEPQPEPQLEPAKPEPQTAAQQDAIPAWRLREEAEGRRRAEAELARLNQRLAQLEQAQPKPPTPDIFEDPNAFVSRGVEQAVNPIKAQMDQMREQFSHMMVIQQHGQDKFDAAYRDLQQAIQQRDPEAVMLGQRMQNGSAHPFGDMMQWHQRRTTVNTIGGDIEAYNKRIMDQAREAALKDPDFLAKAIEAVRANARPVTRPPQPSNVTSLPSVNRATASAGTMTLRIWARS